MHDLSLMILFAQYHMYRALHRTPTPVEVGVGTFQKKPDISLVKQSDIFLISYKIKFIPYLIPNIKSMKHKKQNDVYIHHLFKGDHLYVTKLHENKFRSFSEVESESE